MSSSIEACSSSNISLFLPAEVQDITLDDLFAELEEKEPDIRIFQDFLNQGGDINAQHLDADTLLNRAVKKGYQAIVTFLLEKNADLTIGDKDGDLPLHNAAWHCQSTIAILLLDHGADPSVCDKQQFTPLHQAAFKGQKDLVKRLLKNPLTDVNAKSRGDYTALHATAVTNKFEIAKMLIARGAKIDDQDADGRCALFWAASLGYTQIVNLLLENSASIDLKDQEGRDIFRMASINKQEEILKQLAEKLQRLRTKKHPKARQGRRAAIVSFGPISASAMGSKSMPAIPKQHLERPAPPPKAHSLPELFPLCSYKQVEAGKAETDKYQEHYIML